MGLFDGLSDPAALESADQIGSDGTGIASTAAVADAIEAPVVLVVDASAMSGSVAALVHGFDTYSTTTELPRRDPQPGG